MHRTDARLPPHIYQDAKLLFDFNLLNHELHPCDVAIGLGSHDLGVAELTSRLFHRGLFPLIVFTGANAPTTQTQFPDGEAVHYRRKAVMMDVPPDAIFVEPKATNTWENITFSRRLLHELGVDPKSALLVCRPYQQRRAYATCRRAWPELQVSCASENLAFGEYVTRIGDPDFVVNMLVGDTQRLIEYPKRGHAIEQEIPAPIAAALTRLQAAGYTQRQLHD